MARSVLLATDGSEAARAAEERVRDLLDSDSDRVVVLSVVWKVPPSYLGQGLDPGPLQAELREQAEKNVRGARDRMREAGFDTTTSILEGAAGPTICEAAEQEDVDAIVLGRRGLGQVGEILLGSVSHYVVHHSSRPVVIVPSPEAD